jgi:putative tributyrin esterase
VAGLSMGGYGAFKLGLSYPDRFAAAASFIGVLNLAQTAHQTDWWQNDLRLNFGDQSSLEGGPHDLFHLARQMAVSEGPKTRLYACTGTEDFVYEGNLAFKQLAESLGLDFTYEEGPGEHSWEYVDPMVPKMLAWLGLQPTHE